MNHKLKKFSATDVPEWMPSWIKEHEDIKSIDSLSDIPKDIPIDDFRIEISNQEAIRLGIFAEGKLLPVEEEFKIEFDKLVHTSTNSLYYKADELGDSNLRLFSHMCYEFEIELENDDVIRNFKTSHDIKCVLKINNFDKTFNIPIGTSLAKAGILLEKISEKVFNIQIKMDPQKLQTFSAFSRRDLSSHSFELVFSTQPKDILAMTSRGSFPSCMDLFSFNVGGFNRQAVYSAISRYTGIIYITNKQDFKGRGERIIARSSVFFLERNDHVPVIGLSKLYYSSGKPNELTGLFMDFLKDSSDVPVDDLMTSNYKYSFYTEQRWKEPYFDPDNIRVKVPQAEMESEFEQDTRSIVLDKQKVEQKIQDVYYKIDKKIMLNILNKNTKLYNKLIKLFTLLFNDNDFKKALLKKFEVELPWSTSKIEKIKLLKETNGRINNKTNPEKIVDYIRKLSFLNFLIRNYNIFSDVDIIYNKLISMINNSIYKEILEIDSYFGYELADQLESFSGIILEISNDLNVLINKSISLKRKAAQGIIEAAKLE